MAQVVLFGLHFKMGLSTPVTAGYQNTTERPLHMERAPLVHAPRPTLALVNVGKTMP